MSRGIKAARSEAFATVVIRVPSCPRALGTRLGQRPGEAPGSYRFRPEHKANAAPASLSAFTGGGPGQRSSNGKVDTALDAP